MRWAVVLAGGSGTRFWPLSTPETPEAAPAPLGGRVDRRGGGRAAHRTDSRASASWSSPARRSPGGSARCSSSRPKTSSSSPAPPRPRRRSSGPRGRPSAATLTPRCSRSTPTGRSAMRAAFRRTADVALTTARTHDRLVTVGVVPSRPETGLRLHRARRPARRWRPHRGAVLGEARRRDRARPHGGRRALEQRACSPGRPDRLLAEVARHTPEVAPALPPLQAGDVPGSSRDVTPISIDVGVLERSGARGGGDRRVRLGRRRHLAGAGPRPPQGRERQRARRPGRAARDARLHRLVATAIRSC